jgi:putative inorganic carbon (hco3(-)) transporter
VLKSLPTQRPHLLIYLSAVLLGGLACWAALTGFYLVFLIPVIAAILFYGFLNTEKFILLTGAMAPLSINIEDIGGGFGLAIPTEPLIILVLGLLLFKLLYTGSITKSKLLHPLTLTILGYVAWLWLSSIFSSMPLVSFKSSLARSWYIGVFYFGALAIFKNFSRIHFFLKAITVTTLALVMFTLIKHAAEGFVRSSSYGISWPFFPDHGMYAAAIAICVPVLAFYAFNGRSLGHSWFWLPVAGFFLIVLLFGIVVSYTRATWLSLVAAGALFAALRLKIRYSWILAFLALTSVIAVLKQDDIMYAMEANKQGSSDEIEGHVKSVSNITTDPSNLERLNRWKCASRMVADRPVFGFGPGTFVFQYGVYQKTNEMTIISTSSGDLGDAHSEYFSSLSELGIPGFVLWVAIVLISIGTGFKIVLKTTNKRIKITAYIAMLGLVTYYVHALLNNYSQYDKIAVPMWSFIAIIAALDLYFLPRHQAQKQ